MKLNHQEHLKSSISSNTETRTETRLQGETLKQAAYKLAAEIQTRITETQGGVGTFFDNGFLGLLKELSKLNSDLPWEESARRLRSIRGIQLRLVLPRLQRFLGRRRYGRFVDFSQRFRPTWKGLHSDSDIGILEITFSQGVEECMHWKGLPVFKTVFDFSLYTMMLWNLKPRTIIEIGSGTGASAIWLADLIHSFGFDGMVYSVDLNKPALQYPNVHFIEGDCWKIEEAFADDVLKSAPHPWLLIEDAHVNVGGVLRYFHPYLEQGDYLVIEDSNRKRSDIQNFLDHYPACYKVDTHYTDFFGRNATCAPDSIFARI